MRYIIYGAGGIGGTIGARLFQQGLDVVLIARGEHGRVIRDRGLTLAAPDGEVLLPVPSVAHPGEIEFRPDDVVLLAMKTQHTQAALEDLRSAAPGDVAVVCAQNGVANERMALRCFANVYGMLVHLPALHLEPGLVVTYGTGHGGILDTGRYPDGVDRVSEALTAGLRQAGFSAEPDPAVMRWKYAKLLMNLNNSLQAATGLRPGAEDVMRNLSRRLKHEALACFAAAGIDCADLDDVRRRHEGVYGMGEVPGYPRGGGSTWQSLERGTGNVETDYLNGEVVLLGRLWEVPTPANEVCQAVVRRMASEGLEPGSVTPEQLLAQVEDRMQDRPRG